MNNETALVTAFIDNADLDKPETEVLSTALACVAATLPDGYTSTVDANYITWAFMKRRATQTGRTVREDEVHDYVRHMLREADHVCRGSLDRTSSYRFHKPVKCSGTCDYNHGRAAAKKKGEICQSCFIEMPATNKCDTCD